ncbi:MAG TPA: sodium:solute symporter family protein [Longimicrobiaceae bacterium]|nr:sodium:solute symporter family protein [Longimicrobiaceae bacterium]
MGIQGWTYVIVGLTFALYIGIAIASRVRTTAGFYVAGQGVSAVGNGMATAADWMSAASFISMAGIIAFLGYDGAVYLMGWTGGYVLLALLLAPFLRKFGKFTVPDFVGDRYYSSTARVVAVVAAIFVSFTYVAGQMRGVGVVFSRFLEVPVNTGVVIGMVIVAFYAVLGGMKGVTNTQIAQYCVLIFAYLVPAIAIALLLTGNPVPQAAIGEILPRLDAISRDLGLAGYSSPFTDLSFVNVLFITISLMVGTAGLPHVIVRFYTVRSVRAARWSAGWALLFIAILYTTAPTIAIFAKFYVLESLAGRPLAEVQAVPWVQNWMRTGLITLQDANADGVMQAAELFGANGLTASIDRDIVVLALPEIANLAPFIIALVAAGGLAAALSTASGLLIVISSAIAHDVYGHLINPEASDRKRLLVGRITIALAVVVAGIFGIYPPGFVAEVVAFAFGLAAASFFPVIILGIFWKRATKEGAIWGMISGLTFTAVMILLLRTPQILRFLELEKPVVESFFGINAQGIGTVGMLLNFAVMVVVSLVTPPPPPEVQEMVEGIRYPRAMGAGELVEVRP